MNFDIQYKIEGIGTLRKKSIFVISMFHITYAGMDSMYNDQKGSRIRQSLDIICFGQYHFSKCAQIYDIIVVDACDRGVRER